MCIGEQMRQAGDWAAVSRKSLAVSAAIGERTPTRRFGAILLPYASTASRSCLTSTPSSPVSRSIKPPPDLLRPARGDALRPQSMRSCAERRQFAGSRVSRRGVFDQLTAMVGVCRIGASGPHSSVLSRRLPLSLRCVCLSHVGDWIRPRNGGIGLCASGRSLSGRPS